MAEMNQFTSLIAGLLVTAFSFNAHAAIIDNGTYTTDTESGLDWLDVTLSVNRSYSYMTTQFGAGGEFDGWRFATGDELVSLVDNMGGTGPYEGYSGDHENITTQLISLLGDTYASYIDATGDPGDTEILELDFTIGIIADSFDANSQWRAIIDDFDPSDVLSQGYGADNIDVYGVYWDNSFSSYAEGSYLVRNTVEVSILSTMYLMGFGLLTLIVARNKV